MTEKILFVDDEQNILSAFRRTLRKDFQIETALSGLEALTTLENDNSFAAIISDMRMPGMDGAQFLAKAKEIAPRSVRLMLTGNADQQIGIDAVNEGIIFRCLTKPCSQEIILETLHAAIEQYHLNQGLEVKQ